MNTGTVSIGRNVGEEPMSADTWYLFEHDLIDVVKRRSPAIYFVGEGTGHFEDMREESLTVVFAAPDDGAQFRGLHNELAVLAKRYNQESIALTIGTTKLIGG